MGLLDSILGDGQSGTAPASPIKAAIAALLAYDHARATGNQPSATAAPSTDPVMARGSVIDIAKTLLGGGAGGSALSGGLSGLLQIFESAGHGDKVRSWIASGPNKSISTQDLEQVLGSERIAWLQQKTGMSKDELLAGLSNELPEAVDQLTPSGKLPATSGAAA